MVSLNMDTRRSYREIGWHARRTGCSGSPTERSWHIEVRLGQTLTWIGLFVAAVGAVVIAAVLARRRVAPVDARGWRAMAAASPDLTYSVLRGRPTLAGRHRGVGVSMVAHTAHGAPGTTAATPDHELPGVTHVEISATILQPMPAGFHARALGLGARVGAKLEGKRRVYGDDPAFDAAVLCTTDNVPAAVDLIGDPEVRSGLTALIRDVPAAHVRDRQIRVVVPGMPSDVAVIARWLDRISGAVAVIERGAALPDSATATPAIARARAADAPAGQPWRRPPVVAPTRPATPAPKPTRDLGNVLKHARLVGPERVRLLVHELKHEPLRVRVFAAVVRPTRREGVEHVEVVGQLVGSSARASLLFSAEHAPALEMLPPNARVGGVGTLEDYDATSNFARVIAAGSPLVDVLTPVPLGRPLEVRGRPVAART
jgi:hypothetical protein